MKDTSQKTRQFVGALTLALLLGLTAFAQRQERSIQGWKPLHYDVELNFDDQLSGLSSARAQISIEVLAANLSKVDLDFGDLSLDSVLVSNANARYERTGETLDVMLPHAVKRGDKLNLTINYHGRPKDGLVFAQDRDGNPSATGDNWPNRVHYWIPSLDHPSAKATVNFTVSAPQRYQVIANGKLITMKRNAANSIWTYEETRPIPPYCMIVAVNEGVVIKPPYTTTTNLLFNVPKKDRDYAPKGFSPAEPAVAFFSQTVAPYPYEKLALIVGATRFGGMENSSAIVFTSTLFEPRPGESRSPAGNDATMSRRFAVPKRIESVVAHEIAHQWFGDSVTESTWADLWLSEGFATYFAGLFMEKYDGQDAFREYMRDAARRYFNFEKQARLPIHDTETKDLMSLLNPNNYEKGAWILHMLRNRLGDEAFFKGLRDYYRAHKEANATTKDLRAALEKSSGKDLKEFFTRWIYGAGHPRYRLEWEMLADNQSVKITVIQLQADEIFRDPVPIEITAGGAKLEKTLVPDSKTATLTVSVKTKPTSVQIDPNETLLREIVKD